jgi:hypothetical protein
LCCAAGAQCPDREVRCHGASQTPRPGFVYPKRERKTDGALQQRQTHQHRKIRFSDIAGKRRFATS